MKLPRNLNCGPIGPQLLPVLQSFSICKCSDFHVFILAPWPFSNIILWMKSRLCICKLLLHIFSSAVYLHLCFACIFNCILLPLFFLLMLVTPYLASHWLSALMPSLKLINVPFTFRLTVYLSSGTMMGNIATKNSSKEVMLQLASLPVLCILDWCLQTFSHWYEPLHVFNLFPSDR